MPRDHREEVANGRKPRERRPADVFDRRPPVSIEAESAVLGSIMMDPTFGDEVRALIGECDFFDDANRTIFAAMNDLYEDRQIYDPVVFREYLIDRGEYEQVGGAQYLIKLMNSVATPAHAVHYANIVKAKSIRRSLITAAAEIMQNSYQEGDNVTIDQLVSDSQDRLFRVAEEAGGGVQMVRIEEVVRDKLETLENIRAGRVRMGMETGLRDFDAYLRLRNKEVTILGARPSQGKSALGLNISDHVSQIGRDPVLFVSLEMSTDELGSRYLAARSNINLLRFQTAQFNEDEMQRLTRQAQASVGAPLYLIDSTSLTMSKISAMARIACRAGNCRLLVLDYMQLITPASGRDSREQQVAKISRSIKTLARELDIPILVLAQVNRGAGDNSRAPKLSELRESGSIEQDADNVFFVHRPAYYSQEEQTEPDQPEEVELHIAKQRNGPTGVVSVMFHKHICRFNNLAEDRFDEDENLGGFEDDPFADPQNVEGDENIIF